MAAALVATGDGVSWGVLKGFRSCVLPEFEVWSGPEKARHSQFTAAGGGDTLPKVNILKSYIYG